MDRISEKTCGQSKLCESYFFRVLLLTFLLTWSNPKRALKSAQEQEDWQRRRNKRDRARRAAETAEQRSERLQKRRERDHARHAAQTVSERQATSQWKITGEHRAAETPEERETRNGSSAIRHFEGGDEDVME